MIEANSNLQFFSWSITNCKYAIKIIDKSVIKYGETVIPIEIRNFFEIESYTFGDEIDIIFLYKEEEFNSVIKFENNNNRSKLKLGKEIHKRILLSMKELFIEDDYIISNINMVFRKLSKNKYELKIVKEL